MVIDPSEEYIFLMEYSGYKAGLAKINATNGQLINSYVTSDVQANDFFQKIGVTPDGGYLYFNPGVPSFANMMH